MEPVMALYAFIVSYLLGSLSFGRIVTRIMRPGETLSDVEMPIANSNATYKIQSIGGNTASLRLGARGGCLVGFLDIFKTFLPTLAFFLLYPQQPYFLIAALAGFIGHCWPIYYRFKGGRGISPFYGGLLAFDPLGAVIVAFTSLFIGLVILKELLVAYTGGVVLVLFWFLLTKSNQPLFYYYIAYALLINILFVVAMIPEIRQIIEIRRKYGKTDMRDSMNTFPMGQQMLKLMKKFGLEKKSPPAKG
jgi:acyl phosphate:glycerol-3-phosphate acyltransferase